MFYKQTQTNIYVIHFTTYGDFPILAWVASLSHLSASDYDFTISLYFTCSGISFSELTLVKRAEQSLQNITLLYFRRDELQNSFLEG